MPDDSISGAAWLDGLRLPAAGKPDQARLGFERWREAAEEFGEDGRAFAVALADSRAGHRLLDSLFGNSPFLTQCCLRDPACLRDLVRNGPDATFAEVVAGLNEQLPPGEDRAGLMRRLRVAKRRAALTIAVADLGGQWSLEQVTGALTALAEAALGRAVRFLLTDAAGRGVLTLAHPDDPERDSGLIVLGMGKLGAGELNYSSDIDLIVLFEPDKVAYAGRDSVQEFFARLARDLVRLLQEPTADGYVFRTDLRLRPDPASTPPALSVLAALTYYESTGQNWERAALIKARPVAGDRAAGAAFLRDLRPFLWRKHLDFAAIADIHSIKRQINAHRGGARIAIEGHNVKLGRGGIREIEFFAQTQQLIWGGRIPELRCAETCAALGALAAAGRVAAPVAEALVGTYRFLRRIEHRLQMVDDKQTHTLPSDPGELAAFAVFAGFADLDAFVRTMREQLQTVERHYADLFEEAPTLSGPGNLVFTGTESDPETLATLRRMGFAEPEAVAASVRGWHHGRYRATRSQRAREILTELVPALLAALGRTANPDSAFLRFDQVMARLPAGVQLFSLFHANPGLLDLVARIMGGAPRLAEQLARQPLLLDGVLSAGFFDRLPPTETLARELDQALALARDYQDVLDVARRWANDRRFQIGVQLLRGDIDVETSAASFSDVAEAVIDRLADRVAAAFAVQHGTVPGGAFAIAALGKLGGREMTVSSDLDLIIVYDAPDSVEASTGPRSLPVLTYYTRLTQRLVNALTALTPEGLLYEVDMRLRPSGSAGPTASSFTAFVKYHDELAWTWEHMALTRARLISGAPELRRRVGAVIEAVLRRPRDRDRLVLDIADMRARIAQQRQAPPAFDVKHRRGGLVDVEFLAQYLMLDRAEADATVLKANTADALAALARAGALDDTACATLIEAWRLWTRVQGILRLLVDGPFEEGTTPSGIKQLIAERAGAVDFAQLTLDMDAAAAAVQRIYATVIDGPAAAARARRKGETVA